jgi:hypothetical protein
MQTELDSLSLPELADRLEAMDDRRTPVGWSPEDAVERASIERVIVDLISAAPVPGAPALTSDVAIHIRSKEQTIEARIREIRTGGIYVDTDAKWVRNTHVDMHIRGSGFDDHNVRARGVITKVDDGAVLVSVSEQPSESHERRLRRFLMELLRHRAHT